MWEKIKNKLASRKLWVAITGLVVSILVMFNVPDGSISQVTAIISASGTLVAYIVAEGFIDGKH